MYAFNIGSIATIHPNLAQDPAVQNNQTFAGLHTANVIGPVDPMAAIDVERTVVALTGVRGKCFVTFVCLYTPQLTYHLENYPGLLTEPVVETAQNRAHLLRQTREGFQLIHYLGLTNVCNESITDASLEFGVPPGGLGVNIQEQFNQFQQQQQVFQNNLDNRLAGIGARVENAVIAARN
jgi:hypothetical protein